MAEPAARHSPKTTCSPCSPEAITCRTIAISSVARAQHGGRLIGETRAKSHLELSDKSVTHELHSDHRRCKQRALTEAALGGGASLTTDDLLALFA